METSATLLIAGLSSLFAVSLLFLGLLVSGFTGRRDATKRRGMFQLPDAKPESKVSTQKLRRGHLDIPTRQRAS